MRNNYIKLTIIRVITVILIVFGSVNVIASEEKLLQINPINSMINEQLNKINESSSDINSDKNMLPMEFQSRVINSSNVDIAYSRDFILVSELAEVNDEEEFVNLVANTLDATFTYKNGTEPIEIMNISVSKLTKDSPAGSEGEVTYKLRSEKEQGEFKIKFYVFPSLLFPNIEDLNDNWVSVPLGSDIGVLENPENGSRIGFNRRGITSEATSKFSFTLKDGDNEPYIHLDRQAQYTPYVDGKPLYGGFSKSYQGFGSDASNLLDKYYSTSAFLKNEKENRLKEIIYDNTNQLMYVFDINLEPNLNFNIRLKTYNMALQSRNIAMLEYVDTDYYNDSVPMYTLSNGRGFYMEQKFSNKSDKRMSFLFKERNGDWLTKYQLIAPGYYHPDSDLNKNFPYSAVNLNYANYFTPQFNKPGIERFGDLPTGTVILSNKDTAYQLGTNYETVDTNDYLEVGYQIFLGDELEIMRLSVDPEEVNMYSEDTNDVPINGLPKDISLHYELSDLRKNTDFKGSLYAVSDTGEFVVGTFDSPMESDEATGSTSVEGDITLDKNMFPDRLNPNEKPGIKINEVAIYGRNQAEGRYDGLESNDAVFHLNAYNFGATPKKITVKQNSTWDILPQDLLVDPIYLPENEGNIEYSYVGSNTVDTSTIGLKTIKVRMTDKTDGRFKDYDVLVNVTNAYIPPTGMTVFAEGFSIPNYNVIRGMSKAELDEFIIKESHATAWDNQTGLSDDIDLSVYSTTLKADSKVGTYTATIRGTQGTITQNAPQIKIIVEPPIDFEINTNQLPQDIILGTDLKEKYPEEVLKTWVKDVTYNEKPVDEYVVELIDFDTNQINDGTKDNTTIRVSSGDGRLEMPLQLKVGWGDSVSIGGAGVNVLEGESALAFTLHHDGDKPYLTSSYGNLPNSKINTPFDNQNGNKVFTQLIHYPTKKISNGVSKAFEVTSGEEKVSKTIVNINSDDTPYDKLNAFGDSNRFDVNYGDVFKLYTSFEGNKSLFKDGKGPNRVIAGLPNPKSAFAVVTEYGFDILFLSHLETKPVEMSTGETTTQEDYLTHFNNDNRAIYFTVPKGVDASVFDNVQPNGFKTYPKLNLAVGEESQGVVYVSEQIPTTDNKYLKYAYDMTFVGSGPNLTLGEVPATLSFEEAKIMSHTQNIKQSTPNDSWGFNVLDNRSAKSPWEIQARMEAPFSNGISGDLGLQGAYLMVGEGHNMKEITSEFTPIFINENPVAGINEVMWQNNNGFSLVVPPGNIKKDTPYQTTIDFILIDSPLE